MRFFKFKHVYLWFLVLYLAFVGLVIFACTPQEAKLVQAEVIKVADDVCKEAPDAGADPELVALLCTIDAAGNVANVLLPKTEWKAMKLRRTLRLPSDGGAQDAAK